MPPPASRKAAASLGSAKQETRSSTGRSRPHRADDGQRGRRERPAKTESGVASKDGAVAGLIDKRHLIGAKPIDALRAGPALVPGHGNPPVSKRRYDKEFLFPSAASKPGLQQAGKGTLLRQNSLRRRATLSSVTTCRAISSISTMEPSYRMIAAPNSQISTQSGPKQ